MGTTESHDAVDLDAEAEASKARHSEAFADGYRELDFAKARTDLGFKKVAVITGGNSGLGFESARVLVHSGMRVVIACRSRERGDAAAAKLLELTADRPDPSDDDVCCMVLDVASMRSVRDFAREFAASGLSLHVLMCNAGIMQGPPRTSVDGFDLQFATNYLGHAYLCKLLRTQLEANAPSRVIHLASIAARFGSIHFDDLQFAEAKAAGKYSSLTAYSQSKLLVVAYSRELARRLDGTGVTSNSLEPGVVATNLSKGITDDPDMRKRLEDGVTVEEGAHCQVWLAGSAEVEGQTGKNWENCKDISHGLGKLKYGE